MRLLHIDATFGLSEDRLLAALIDLAAARYPGVPEGLSLDTLRPFLPEGDVSSQQLQFQGGSGTHLTIAGKPAALAQLRNATAALPEGLRWKDRVEKALRLLESAGAFEAPMRESVQDSPGSVSLLPAIAQALGSLSVEQVQFSSIGIGVGGDTSARVVYPSPIVARLLAGHAIHPTGFPVETVTPGAAAFLTVAGVSVNPMATMRLLGTGCGIGVGQWPIPNVTQVFLGEAALVSESKRIRVLETNLDDMAPQLLEYAMACLLEGGALDVYFTPIQMKKNRPAVLVSVLCAEEKLNVCLDILLRETTTLGVRILSAERRCLERRFLEVTTPFGDVPVKAALIDGAVRSVMPEYDVCRKLATSTGAPLRRVQETASQEAWRRLEEEGVRAIGDTLPANHPTTNA